MIESIVAITGFKRNGKDTVANLLREEYGYTVMSLAQPLKEIVAIAFGWDESIFEGPGKEEVDPKWGISPRQALQHLGTEWGQFGLCDSYPLFKESTGRCLWVRSLLTRAEKIGGKIVIPDFRFHHEARELAIYCEKNKIPYTPIRVLRPGYTTNGKDLHASEKDIPELPVMYQIENGGDVDALYGKVRIIAKGAGL